MQPMTSGVAGPPTPVKPKGAAGLWIGGLIIAAGIVLGIVLVVQGIMSISQTVDRYQRVPAAGGGEIEVTDTGTYRLYFEVPSEGGSLTFQPSAPAVTVIDPNGEQIPVTGSGVSETYDFGGRSGRSMGRFAADTPGTYEIRTSIRDGSGGTGQIAVGERGPLRSIATILGGVFGGLAVVVVGVVVMIVSGVRRGRARRAAQGFGPGGRPLTGWAVPPTGPQGWAPPPGPAGWVPPPSAPGPSGPSGPPGWAPPPPPSPPPPADPPWSPPTGQGPIS